MINITLKEIVESTEVLRKLATEKLRGRVAFQISKLLKKLEEELNLFNSARADIIKKYSEIDENGEIIQDSEGSIKLQEDKIEDMNLEISELLNTSIEINENKINLGDIEDLNFTPTEMVFLTPLIQE